MLQISAINKETQTIDVAVGFKYDDDALRVYQGKISIKTKDKLTPIVSKAYSDILKEQGIITEKTND